MTYFKDFPVSRLNALCAGIVQSAEHFLGKEKVAGLFHAVSLQAKGILLRNINEILRKEKW